jgi:hypothetical protein
VAKACTTRLYGRVARFRSFVALNHADGLDKSGRDAFFCPGGPFQFRAPRDPKANKIKASNLLRKIRNRVKLSAMKILRFRIMIETPVAAPPEGKKRREKSFSALCRVAN